MVSIKCEHCGKRFQAKYSFELHKQNCLKSNVASFECQCGKKFASRNNYYTHKHVCQNNASKFACREVDCAYKTNFKKEFVSHLMIFHGINVQEVKKSFNNYSEFEAWKESHEKSTKSEFVATHAYDTKEGKMKLFRCNRSGKYRTNVLPEERKRSIKSQGTMKIGFECTGSMKVEISKSTGIVMLTLFQHYGHEHQLSHLRIPATDRKIMASELSEGVKPSRVMSNLYSDHFQDLERKHICTKQDLRNITRQYGLEKVEKHSEDHVSVDMYVAENLQDVLLYKRQFEDSFHLPNNIPCPLNKEDFVLCMMTAFQKKMLSTFGNDIICCDATHGTNSYSFKLVTLLVVDEFREGVPVAWMISNRETATALTVFFNAVKEAMGEEIISPKIFMSDKAPQFFNSFHEVFGGDIKKLLCHWHVLKDLNLNVRSKVKDPVSQSSIYKALCTLLEEPHIDEFRKLLSNFMDALKMSPLTSDFLLYFEREWLGIQEEWAKCFRVSAGINTNMFLEAFHKKLKYGEGFLEGKQGKRVDKTLSILFDFVKDMMRRRIVKLEKRPTSKKGTQINKSHRA